MDSIRTYETVSGTVENVVYRNENNDYTVLEIATPENELITAVGIIPVTCEGEKLILRGAWSYHKDFGKQFGFEEYEKSLPSDEEGIIRYLSSGAIKGVGPATALRIVNRFRADSFDVIENHPEWLADIQGITMKKAAAISSAFREQAGLRDIMMLCKDYIATSEATRAYKRLGAGAASIIKENPYVLCDEEYGISFKKIDAFAKTLSFPPLDPIRILSAAKYLLSYNAATHGHTCLPMSILTKETSELVEADIAVIQEMLLDFCKDGSLSSYSKDGVNFVMTNEIFEAEEYISERLLELDLGASSFSRADVGLLVEKLELRLGIEYARMQKEAIYEALRNGVMILTGGPGTGKTTVVKALIEIFDSLGMKCALAAPTGRAAKRLSETTAREAKTVHRMLEMEITRERKSRFGRDERHPLDERVVIVDETSMMDLSLTAALLRAMKRGSRLILIGDADQLPSVGAGNVFADLIASEKIKIVRLTDIFRQSGESLIVTNAHRINRGEEPLLNVTDNDFFFVNREFEGDIKGTISSLITERLPKRYGAHIKNEIQVITPSKKGSGGVEVLNLELQARINPPAKFKKEKLSHGTVFREGDRVMQTVNNYDIEWEKNGYVGNGIFNGDIGVIDSINNTESTMTVRFDDKTVQYDFDLLEDLELAYAITVHKSLGSEYPVVIIPSYRCAPMLMTRNLLYTAVTRAKRMVIVVGRRDIPKKMVDNDREILRYTTLKERISALKSC